MIVALNFSARCGLDAHRDRSHLARRGRSGETSTWPWRSAWPSAATRYRCVVLRPRLPEEWPTRLPVVHLDIHKNPASVAAGFRRGRQFLREFLPDVVHSHSFHANMLARLLAVGVPRAVVVSTVHNVYEGGWMRMMAYRLTDGLSQRTVTVSEAAAERFIRLKAIPRHKCLVRPNGIDTARVCTRCRAPRDRHERR